MPVQKNAPSTKTPEIRKGDTVVVLHGKDAGKRGTVDRVVRNPQAFEKTKRGYWRKAGGARLVSVVVSGVNIAKRHTKPQRKMSQNTQQVQPGGIVEKPMPIDVSNVMIVCPRCERVTRVAHERLGSGQSVRVCTHCREQLEAGA